MSGVSGHGVGIRKSGNAAGQGARSVDAALRLRRGPALHCKYRSLHPGCESLVRGGARNHALLNVIP